MCVSVCECVCAHSLESSKLVILDSDHALRANVKSNLSIIK